MSSAITIRQAETAAEREAIYRFRYDVYVREMQRVQHYADHARKWVKEPLDETAHLFGAFEHGRIIGTYRVNFARESELGYYEELYGMDWAGRFHPAHTSISTKFMVAREYRGSRLSLKLAVAAYRFARARAIEFDFIDCNEHLVSFFQWLGYRQYRAKMQHPEYGEVMPLVMAVADEAHLRAVKSPFSKFVNEARTTVEPYFCRREYWRSLQPFSICTADC